MNLSLLAGTQTGDLGGLFGGSSDSLAGGGSLLTPLLDFGRIEANVEAARALRAQAEVQYRRNVQTAFQEVRDALTFLQIANERLKIWGRQVDTLQRTLALAKSRYQSGTSDYIEVLDAQRQLLTAELAATQADGDHYIAMATLFKALGGGWQTGKMETSPSVKPAHKNSEKIAS